MIISVGEAYAVVTAHYLQRIPIPNNGKWEGGIREIANIFIPLEGKKSIAKIFREQNWQWFASPDNFICIVCDYCSEKTLGLKQKARDLINRIKDLHIRAGLVHGDVKPDNTVICNVRDENKLFLIDFQSCSPTGFESGKEGGGLSDFSSGAFTPKYYPSMSEYYKFKSNYLLSDLWGATVTILHWKLCDTFDRKNVNILWPKIFKVAFEGSHIKDSEKLNSDDDDRGGGQEPLTEGSDQTEDLANIFWKKNEALKNLLNYGNKPNWEYSDKELGSEWEPLYQKYIDIWENDAVNIPGV